MNEDLSLKLENFRVKEKFLLTYISQNESISQLYQYLTYEIKMHIITKKALQSFWEKYLDSENALRSWFSITKKAKWNNLAEVRQDFPHADLVGVCTAFNIGGNKYRLITKIYYPNKTVLIRFVLTHKEYDKKPYKNDCEC